VMDALSINDHALGELPLGDRKHGLEGIDAGKNRLPGLVHGDERTNTEPAPEWDLDRIEAAEPSEQMQDLGLEKRGVPAKLDGEPSTEAPAQLADDVSKNAWGAAAIVDVAGRFFTRRTCPVCAR
jgi:hypothetical protein